MNPDLADLERAEQLLYATLLFHKGGEWTPEDQNRWEGILKRPCLATTKNLCDEIREYLGRDLPDFLK